MRRVVFAPAAAVALLSDLGESLKITLPGQHDELAQTGAEFDHGAVAQTASADTGGLRAKVQEAQKTPYLKEKDA